MTPLDKLRALEVDGNAGRCTHWLKAAAKEGADEIERLRALLKHADDVVIWEHTPARSGFQEEIEEALGIGNEQITMQKDKL